MRRRTTILAAIALCGAVIFFVVYSILSVLSTVSTPLSPETRALATASSTEEASVPTRASTSTAVHAAVTPASPVVRIDGQRITVTLALTPAQQEKGLGGRSGLGDHEGMLFVFPADDQHLFWMKDMHFSIDMIWFSSDGTVIYIQPNVSPATYPEAFGPSEPSRYVLEMPANFASTYGIKIGDQATLPL